MKEAICKRLNGKIDPMTMAHSHPISDDEVVMANRFGTLSGVDMDTHVSKDMFVQREKGVLEESSIMINDRGKQYCIEDEDMQFVK